MKKFVCVAMVLALCLGMTAFAAVPSRPVGTVDAELPYEDATISTEEVPAGMEAIAQRLDAVADGELTTLFTAVQDAATTEEKNDVINSYFNTNFTTMLIGSGELTVTDFMTAFVTDFPKAVGGETFEMKMAFNTKFVPGSQVIIAVGILGPDGTIIWTYVIGDVLLDGSVACNMPLKVMNDVEANGGILSAITYSNNIAA